MASRKSCIVHYEIKDEKYSCLGNISENAYQRILQAKTIREELRGANFHREKCLMFLIQLSMQYILIHVTKNSR